MTERYNALVVTPAYGRDYKNKTQVQLAWDTNVDFEATNTIHRYVSKQDLENYPHAYTHVQFRYGKLQKVMVIKL